MAEIEFIAAIGDTAVKVTIGQVPYAAGSWHIKIENEHQGTIFERNGEYYYHDADKTLNADDVQAIVDRITEFKEEPYHQAYFYYFSTGKEYWSKFDVKRK